MSIVDNFKGQKIDKKIDQEVYKLYGLTSEEIKIIEGSIFHLDNNF